MASIADSLLDQFGIQAAECRDGLPETSFRGEYNRRNREKLKDMWGGP